MSNKPYADETLLTIHELAGRLYVSRSTVDRWVKEGKVPVVTHPLGPGHGRRVFFDWGAITKALKIPG